MKTNWYVGIRKGTTDSMVFSSDVSPTKNTHSEFSFFVGPFYDETMARKVSNKNIPVSICSLSK